MMRLLLLVTLIGAASAFAPFLARSVHTRKVLLEMGTHIDVNMPALSSTMKEGKIVSWNKKIGDKVNSGDVLLVVESDKADMDVESFEGGYLAAIYTPEGESAPVGSVVAVLVEDAADIGKVSSSPSSIGSVAKSEPTSPKAPESTTSSAARNVPDFEPISMPALSSTMKEGKIVSWSKKVGDKVSSGDMVLVVESDKADMDVESFEEGYLAAIVVQDGEMASVGSPVGYLTKTAAEIAGVQAFLVGGGELPAKPVDPDAPEPFQVIAPAATSSSSSSSSASSGSASPTVVNAGRVSASGYAQSVAKEQGINLATVAPSRPDGYIIAKDLASGSKGSTGAGIGAGHTHVPAAGTINASPSARKLAAENKLDVSKIAGSGNFGRVLPDDVLKAAGKYVPPKVSPSQVAVPSAAAVASSGKPSSSAASADGTSVLDGLVAMDGMQKAVAKNMEKTLTVPVFRVSRYVTTNSFLLHTHRLVRLCGALYRGRLQ